MNIKNLITVINQLLWNVNFILKSFPTFTIYGSCFYCYL